MGIVILLLILIGVFVYMGSSKDTSEYHHNRPVNNTANNNYKNDYNFFLLSFVICSI